MKLREEEKSKKMTVQKRMDLESNKNIKTRGTKMKPRFNENSSNKDDNGENGDEYCSLVCGIRFKVAEGWV
jgi:hypothetical protein